MSEITADPKTLWLVKWGKRTAGMCAWLKAAFQNHEPSHRLGEGVVMLLDA